MLGWEGEGTGARAGAAGARSAGHAHARASRRALRVRQGRRGGEEGGAVPAVLSRDRWSVPGALAAGTRGPRAPLGLVLGVRARVHPTLLVHHPLGWCPGPVVGGFAPGTQLVGRAGEYSGAVWCGVVWCGVVRCGVVWCGVVWCDVVCRRRCYKRAKAGMSTHGYR